jgi:hypothetical protein
VNNFVRVYTKTPPGILKNVTFFSEATSMRPGTSLFVVISLPAPSLKYALLESIQQMIQVDVCS